jgi:hypothetical protein
VHWTLKDLRDEDHDAVLAALQPKLRLLLIIWLAVVIAAAGALLVSRGSADVLRFIGFSSIMGFHLIWWPFVVPVFRRMESELKRRGLQRSAQAAGPVRTAQLRPRRASEYLSPWMNAFPVGITVAGVATLTWRLALYPPAEMRIWVLSTVFGTSAVVFWATWSAWVRKEIAMSYPVDEAGELAEAQIAALESLRRFRVLGIYWLQIAASAFFFAAAILCVEVGRGAISEVAVGVFGGVAGSVLGIAGGVFGTIASIRMHRALRTRGAAAG